MKNLLFAALMLLTASTAQAQSLPTQTFRRCLHCLEPDIPIFPEQTIDGRKRAMSTSTSDGLGSYNVTANGTVPSIGTVKLPIVMVQFTDLSFKAETTTEKVSRMFNENSYHDEEYAIGSVRDYFIDNSDGLFAPEFVVLDNIITADYDFAYYGENSGSSHNAKMTELYQEVVRKSIENGVDFMEFCYEDTKNVPMLLIYYAGEGENEYGANANLIWPHYNPSSLKITDGAGNTLFTIGSYNACNEWSTNNKTYTGIGVLVHEFCHGLGLPDFYPTNNEIYNTPDFWSIMDYGPYLYNGYRPVGMTAYERSYLGWLDVKELTEKEAVTLAKGAAAVIRNSANNNEYYLLENRQDGTWHPESYFGTGLLVMHVDFSSELWSSNKLNNTSSHLRMKVLPAADQWIGITSSDFSWSYLPTVLFASPYVTPAVTTIVGDKWQPYTGNIQPVYDIKQNDDHTVEFSFIEQGLTTHIAPTLSPSTSHPAYDLQGRRVTTTPRGLYIIDGKKVVR